MSGDEELAWETIGSSIAYTCPGFDIRRDTVRLPDGTETDFDYLVDDESVVVVPFTPDGEVVVIEEWRQAVGRACLGFPAGGVEPEDADPAAAARRELAEETGYVAGSVEPLVSVEPANGIANARHHYFVARGCTPDADQDLDHNESIRVSTTTLEALERDVAGGAIDDGRTVLGTLYYRLAAGGEPPRP